MNTIHRKIWNLIRGGSFHGYLRTVSGYPLTLTGCMPEYPVSLSVAGNAVQDGTPTPDNPVEVQGVGDRTNNLLPMSILPQGTSNGVTVIIKGNNVTVSGTTINYPSFASQPLDLAPGDYYFYVNTINDRWYRIRRTFEDGTYKDVYANSIFTITGDEKARVRIALMAAGNTIDETVNIAIYPVNKITDTFEPYGYKIPITVSGRNLFNIADRTTIEPEYAVPAVKRYFNNNVIVGIALNGYTNCGLCDKISVTTDYITLTSRSGYGIGFDFDVLEGEKYTIKVNTDAPSNTIASFAFYNSEGVYVSNTGTGTGTFKTITIPSGVVKMILILRSNLSGTTITVSDIMLIKGTYSADTMPAYEPYHTPQTIPIYTDAPIYGNGTISDTVELDVENRKATCTKRISVDEYGNITQIATPVTTDISDMQDWDSIPKLWRGTVILTADTTIQPSGLTVKYYADKPGEEVS